MKERLDKELSSIRTSIKGNTKSHNELSRSVIKRLSTSAKENSTLIEQQAAGNKVIIVSSQGALIAIATIQQQQQRSHFVATLVALHFTLVCQSLGRSFKLA